MTKTLWSETLPMKDASYILRGMTCTGISRGRNPNVIQTKWDVVGIFVTYFYTTDALLCISLCSPLWNMQGLPHTWIFRQQMQHLW